MTPLPSPLAGLGSDPVSRGYLAVWLLVLGLLVQVRLVNPLSPNLGLYLAVIVVCGALAAGLVASAVRVPPAAAVNCQPSLSTWWTGAAGLAGCLCAAIGARLVGGDEWSAQWWWLAGMAIPLLALTAQRVALWRARPASRPRIDRVELGIVGGILLVALAARVPDILASPPFLFGDEASCGLYGRLFNAGHTPLLSISWYGLPMLSYAVSGLGLRLFGDTMIGLREINAVIGSIGVVLVYLLGKAWFGRRAGILAALILAVSFLHVELSRDGLHYIQGPTCITISLLLTTLFLKRGGLLFALLAGMSVSLDLQVYWSARVAPLLMLALFAYLLLFQRSMLRARLEELSWLLIGVIVADLPLIGLFRANPGTFNGHQGAVSIFSSDPNTRGHLVSLYGHIGTLDLIAQQAWRVLTTFNARGDASALFGAWPGTLLDAVTAILLPAAVVLALVRWRRWEWVVCLGWFASIVLASIVTIDPPIWPRLGALTPAVALLVGAFLADLSRLLAMQLSRWTVWAGLGVLLSVIATLNFGAAFVDYPAVALQYDMEATDVGRFLAQAPGAGDTVLLSDGSMYVNYEPIQFLAPRATGCTLFAGMPLSQCPLARHSRLFVLLPGRVGDLPWLERQRPGGKVVAVATYSYGTAHILAYEL